MKYLLDDFSDPVLHNLKVWRLSGFLLDVLPGWEREHFRNGHVQLHFLLGVLSLLLQLLGQLL